MRGRGRPPSGSALLDQAPARADPGGFSTQLDAAVPELLDDGAASGAAVALVRGGRPVIVRGYGVADRETGAPVTPATRFQVASVTTPLTAWAVLRPAEEGRPRLDDLVAPWGAGLRRMLSHTAGFPEHECLGLRAQPTIAACLAGKGGGEPLRRAAGPGAAFACTNAGFLVAQAEVERAAGAAWTRGGAGAIAPASIALFLAPAPGAAADRGPDARASHGLGVALGRLPGGALLASHKGDNPGRTALVAAVPERGDGLVVLSNGEQAGDVTRGVLCRSSALTARALPRRCARGG